MSLNYDFTLLIMVFMRITGCIMLNPFFGRKNIPPMFKAGLCLIMTLFTYSTLNQKPIEITSVLVFIITLFFEFIIGFVIGFIMNLFLSTLIVAGEMMDMQIGLSMSKIYDPGSNVSMPVTSSLINAMLLMIFFISNGHLTLIKIFSHSIEAIPLGTMAFSPEVFKDIALMFSTILIYSVKLAMPILAAEIIAEIGVGIIMKAVPQINVFVVNIQLKVIIGFVVLLLLIAPFASFIEKLLSLMFENINQILFAVT
ncbi:MAG: flagellar biosynthetic protein FliR [Oscillospiraceae bacterium]